jgi:hypothetical protein
MRAHIRTVIVVALSIGMLAWFLRGADLRDVWTEIQGGRIGLLVFAVGVTVMTYLFRAIRWQYLLRPLGNPRFSDTFKATVIGFAVSTLLPASAARGGAAAGARAALGLQRNLGLCDDHPRAPARSHDRPAAVRVLSGVLRSGARRRSRGDLRRGQVRRVARGRCFGGGPRLHDAGDRASGEAGLVGPASRTRAAREGRQRAGAPGARSWRGWRW